MRDGTAIRVTGFQELFNGFTPEIVSTSLTTSNRKSKPEFPWFIL
jgi:hypothetical protein